jgi:phospholipase C
MRVPKIGPAMGAVPFLLSPLLSAGWPSTARAAPTFRHIIVVVQENRTPDNMFGSNPTFEPGVDIATNGVSSTGQTIPLTAVALNSCYDMSHDHAAFEASLQGADLDPVTAPKGCTVPSDPQFKYVDNSTGTVQPYFDIATNYGFANRMFQTSEGPSFPAHQFLFGGTSAPSLDSSLFAAENNNGALGSVAGCLATSATTVNLIDGFGSETSNPPIYPCLDHPTLTDLMEAAIPAISWRYYAADAGSIWTAPNAIEHICVPNSTHTKCTGTAWANGSVVARNPGKVLTDISNCNLQAMSWVTPTGPESDHAGGNTGLGPAWVASIVNAVGTQAACASGETYWNDTAIIITWDDWGGWFDHVKPPAINLQPTDAAMWGDGYTYGFRVPMLVVSAYTPAAYVSNKTHDFGSILYFVEHNFGLGFINGTDTSTYGRYADYAAESNGDLSEFFSLKTARTYVSIPSKISPAYFVNAPRSLSAPDSD